MLKFIVFNLCLFIVFNLLMYVSSAELAQSEKCKAVQHDQCLHLLTQILLNPLFQAIQQEDKVPTAALPLPSVSEQLAFNPKYTKMSCILVVAFRDEATWPYLYKQSIYTYFCIDFILSPSLSAGIKVACLGHYSADWLRRGLGVLQHRYGQQQIRGCRDLGVQHSQH